MYLLVTNSDDTNSVNATALAGDSTASAQQNTADHTLMPDSDSQNTKHDYADGVPVNLPDCLPPERDAAHTNRDRSCTSFPIYRLHPDNEPRRFLLD